MKRSEFKEFINELLKDGRIKSIQITGWKECGEFDGDDPRPTLQIETRPIGEWPALSEQELSRKPVETTNERPLYTEQQLKHAFQSGHIVTENLKNRKVNKIPFNLEEQYQYFTDNVL